MLTEKGENEVEEVEVERLPPGGGELPPPGPDSRQKVRGAKSALGPIVAGLLVDALDGATLTPVLGLALGFPLGLFIAIQLGVRGSAAWQLAVVIALYCAIPGTSFLPLGTMVGVFARLRQAM